MLLGKYVVMRLSLNIIVSHGFWMSVVDWRIVSSDKGLFGVLLHRIVRITTENDGGEERQNHCHPAYKKMYRGLYHTVLHTVYWYYTNIV